MPKRGDQAIGTMTFKTLIEHVRRSSQPLLWAFPFVQQFAAATRQARDRPCLAVASS